MENIAVALDEDMVQQMMEDGFSRNSFLDGLPLSVLALLYRRKQQRNSEAGKAENHAGCFCKEK